MSLSKNLTVRPIQDQSDMDALNEAAKDDNFGVLFPTHIIRKNGQVVGYFSIGPICIMWFDSENFDAKDTIHLFPTFEALIAQTGLKKYIVLCERSSPFFPYLEKLGYSLGEDHVFAVKSLYSPEGSG